MDWKLLLTAAVLSALGTLLVRLVFGRKVAQLFGWIGTLLLVVPLGLIIVFGIMEANRGDPFASSDTLSGVLDYIWANLPGVIVSAVVGAVFGFMIKVVKKATPRKLQTKVKRQMRLYR